MGHFWEFCEQNSLHKITTEIMQLEYGTQRSKARSGHQNDNRKFANSSLGIETSKHKSQCVCVCLSFSCPSPLLPLNPPPTLYVEEDRGELQGRTRTCVKESLYTFTLSLNLFLWSTKSKAEQGCKWTPSMHLQDVVVTGGVIGKESAECLCTCGRSWGWNWNMAMVSPEE